MFSGAGDVGGMAFGGAYLADPFLRIRNHMIKPITRRPRIPMMRGKKRLLPFRGGKGGYVIDSRETDMWLSFADNISRLSSDNFWLAKI